MITWTAFKKNIKRDKVLYLLLALPFFQILIFKYIPLMGVIIAFQDYDIMGGIFNSEWVGFKWFISFFNSYNFWKLLRNTVLLSLYSLIFGFPAPIILALSLNEVKCQAFKRFTQTVSYLPHFISTVVVAGMVVQFLSPSTGLVNILLQKLGIEPIYFLVKPEWFRTIYVSSGIWKSMGWTSIIYLAALTSIDEQLYEAATIDGAGRFRKLIHITLPGIAPTIVVLLLLKVGNLLDTGFEKILLLYSPMTYETADVIDTFVYRRGLGSMDYSYATAVGLFKSVVGLIILSGTNWLSRKVTETSLW